MQKGVKISGTVFAENGDLSHDEFLDAFIEFIESKGWEFGGGSRQIHQRRYRCKMRHPVKWV